MVFNTSCSVNVLDYIGNKIEIDENIARLNSISYRDMVSITGGTYTQTDGTDNFNHTISDFKLGQYEVTYELWYTVHDWAIFHEYFFSNPGIEGHDGYLVPPIGELPTIDKYEPVTTINWRDAIVWCNAYSEMLGYIPVYENESGQIIKDSRDSNAAECDGAEPDWNNNGYRLPTEGEWQYAASDKGSTPYNYGSGGTGAYTGLNATDYPLFNPIAWYGLSITEPIGNTTKTQNVRTKNANQLGIRNMTGNVWEWCWDWFGNYPGDSTDYTGLSSGSDRVLRGGSWRNVALYLQLGFRIYGNPSSENDVIGFRLALGQ